LENSIWGLDLMRELTKIEEILLWAIAELEDDAYGVRIRQHISLTLGLDYTYGNLYSALGRLDQKGYVIKRPTGGAAAARQWYWRHLLKSVPAFFFSAAYWRMTMFKNYWTIA
jgi:hypothetical protein